MKRIAVFAIACAAAALASATVRAQSPEGGPRLPAASGERSAPAGPDAAGAPGPTSDIIGPDSSFRLTPDGVTWERFQTVRAIGVRCTKKTCGEDRVFCMIQTRSADGARAGTAASQAQATEFGAGVLRNAPKELATDYVAPFAERTFGVNPGQWAELKAEGGPGSLRFALFLTQAEKRLVAFNCVSPAAKWDENKPRFERLLASLEIVR